LRFAAPLENLMQRPTLKGRSILIVEDEPLIAMDITRAFEGTGAALTTTNSLHQALVLVEHDGLSGAILDHSLGDGNSSLLYARLKAKGIPFMIYSRGSIRLRERVTSACLKRRFESLPSTIQRQAKGVKNQNPTCDLPCVFPADGRHRLSLM
jgi:CheY-like chemotaxis protein